MFPKVSSEIQQISCLCAICWPCAIAGDPRKFDYLEFRMFAQSTVKMTCLGIIQHEFYFTIKFFVRTFGIVAIQVEKRYRRSHTTSAEPSMSLSACIEENSYGNTLVVATKGLILAVTWEFGSAIVKHCLLLFTML